MNFADNYYKKNIITKLVGKEELLAAYCVSTNMPLVECSTESFNDRVYVFAQEDLLKTFAKPYFDKKLPLKGIKFPVKDKLKFFNTLLCIGADELVYVDQTGNHVIPLKDFLKKQDFSKLPLAKRPIDNPQLQLSGIYFAQEASRNVPAEEKQSLKELEEELAVNMVKGTFILPVDFLTPVKTDEAGTSAEEAKASPKDSTDPVAGQERQFRLPLIKDPKGDLYLPLFTDHVEFSKYNKDNKLKALAVPFANLEKMLVKEARGYLLNPNGFHLHMTRELLKGLPLRFPKETAEALAAAQAAAAAARPVRADSKEKEENSIK